MGINESSIRWFVNVRSFFYLYEIIVGISLEMLSIITITLAKIESKAKMCTKITRQLSKMYI